MLNFNDIFVDDTKYGMKIPKEKYLSVGLYPVIDQSKEQIAGYTDESEGIYCDVPAIIFGDHTRIIKYIDVPFFLGADGTKLLKIKDNTAFNCKYLYYALSNAKIPNTGYNRHFKWLKELSFNIPSIEKQREIADLMDIIVNLENLRKKQLEKLELFVKSRFIEMFGDPKSNPKGWNKKTLSEIITKANNGMARRGNDESGSIVLRLVELQGGFIDYSKPNRIILTEKEQEKYLLQENDILFARVNGNPLNVGRCAVFHTIDEAVYHNDHIIRVHFDDSLINGVFASNILNSEYGKDQLKNKIKTSAGQYTISQDGIGAIESIMPPIELQNQYADFVAQVDKSKFVVTAKFQ